MHFVSEIRQATNNVEELHIPDVTKLSKFLRSDNFVQR